MTQWPARIPYDLKVKFEELAERRYSESDQDRWAAIKEWLEKHNVQAPDQLLREPEIANSYDWLDGIERPAAPRPFARSPEHLELQERKMLTKTIQEIVRSEKGLEHALDFVKRNFEHLDREDFVSVYFILRRSLINLTDVNSVVFGLTADEVADWNNNQKSDFVAMSADEWDKLRPLVPDQLVAKK